MTIEQHIEELRAELKNTTCPIECREIGKDIALAQAELAALVAERVGSILADPPA